MTLSGKHAHSSRAAGFLADCCSLYASYESNPNDEGAKGNNEEHENRWLIRDTSVSDAKELRGLVTDMLKRGLSGPNWPLWSVGSAERPLTT